MNKNAHRIFIVEDQRIVAADIEGTLRDLGYAVAGSAASGELAVKRVLDARPDLVLMDVRLEGKMDGIEAAGLIRKTYDVPIVYLTAYADEATIVRAKGTSAFGYLVKPFNERELRGAIEVALYKHETDSLLRQREIRLAEAEARRQAAAAEEKRFQLLVESVKDYAIVMLDPAGRIASWNSGAQRITQYPPEEVLGQPFQRFYTAEDAQRGAPAAALAAALRDGRFEEQGLRLRRDGATYWADVVLTAVRDETGELRGFASVMRDLSEQKRTQETERLLDNVTLLLSSSLEMGATLQHAVELVVPLLGDTCLVDLVKEQGGLVVAAAANAGTSQATKILDEVTKSPGRHNAAEYVFRSGGHVLHQQILKFDDVVGEDIPVSYLCAPIELRGRRLGLLELLCRPPRSPYTPADLGVAQELARRIGIALDNARLYREAQQAIHARDEFLAIASHELRTPLTPLHLQLTAIERSLQNAGLRNDDLISRVERCSRQAERLTRLAETLLDVTRIRTGQLGIEPELLDLCALVREVVERFEYDAANLKTKVELSPCTSLVGTWDRARIEQVVTNLLSNALKYGAGKPVQIEVTEEDDRIKLSVKDQGIGIAADSLTRIFDRFERAASTRNYGGLGLGLFITKEIVEAHGGSIAVASKPGGGTTFTVTLPKGDVAAAEPA